MPNELQCEQPNDEMRRDEHEAIDKRIREQVIQALGKPTDLRNVQVRKVRNDHYRVNVIVGANAACVRIANSYLLKVDSNGSLIAATPKITKLY
jgi:hypothetical protein